MNDWRPYLRPGWFERHVVAAVPGADRLVAWLMSRVTGDAVLQIRGRRSGRVRTTLARPCRARKLNQVEPDRYQSRRG